MLLLQHPEVATRECHHCQAFLYDIETGAPKTVDRVGPDGKVVAENIPRPKAVLPPCQAPRQSCPKGQPDGTIELSVQNWQAYTHYHRCRAVNRFPEDSLVEQNAGIIEACYRAHEESQQRLLIEYLRLCAIKPTM